MTEMKTNVHKIKVQLIYLKFTISKNISKFENIFENISAYIKNS